MHAFARTFLLSLAATSAAFAVMSLINIVGTWVYVVGWHRNREYLVAGALATVVWLAGCARLGMWALDRRGER